MVQTASLLGTHALGYKFESAARLSKRAGSVCGTMETHTSKISWDQS